MHPDKGLINVRFPYASSRFTNVNRLYRRVGWLVIYSYAPSFFEPFGMYCPLTIDQIHQTEKFQFRTAAESSDLSTKGFVGFLWIALGEIYQS